MIIGRHVLSGVALVAVLAMSLGAVADSLVEMLLRIAGLTAAPSQLRGSEDLDGAGSIWIADLDRETASPLTPDSSYRSPVFSPADGTLIALRGDTVVRVPVTSGMPTVIQRVTGTVKLVGFDGRNPDLVVILRDHAGAPLGVLSLKTGTLTPLPYDAASSEQQRMLAQIRGQDRVYGTTRVYVKTESKRGLSRTIEWTDVYVQQGDAERRNVSRCDGMMCGQPALSPDGRRVAFVKTAG
jgi:hypothetical protein